MSFSFLGQGNDPDKASFRGQEFPTSVLPLADLTPTRWLTERTRPIGRGDGVHLWSINPEGYPAYARILHLAYCPSDDSPDIVATEIDFVETYVGGSADCINQLLGDPELEAFPVSFDARVDFSADTINI